jgi:multiple sugar transport system ATP-binding protein
MGRVAFTHVTKRFGDTVAVDDLTLQIDDGEFFVLLGPSGCGKSTALRMVAGLEDPTEGLIEIGDRVVNRVEPKDRDVAMVFQSYALYPHLTVRKNVEFPLRTRDVDRKERKALVGRAAESLGLTPYLDRKPAQLSGGQRQRVALARAIVRRPAVFLMDEPLSNLDAQLRVQTRGELVALQRELGTTVIYVTHDQVEAMTMGHRIAILRDGVLQQLGAPQEVYDAPANRFVAEFIGTPPMNVFTDPKRGDVLFGVRPEHIGIVPDGPWPGTVFLVESLGHERLLHARLASGEEVVVRQPGHVEATLGPGDAVYLGAAPEHVYRFDPTTGERLAESSSAPLSDAATTTGDETATTDEPAIDTTTDERISGTTNERVSDTNAGVPDGT